MPEPGSKSSLRTRLAIFGGIAIFLVIGVIIYLTGRSGGIGSWKDKTEAASKTHAKNSSKTTKPEQSSQEAAELKSQIAKLEAKQHLAMGLAHAKNKNYDNSISEFALAIKEDPGYALAYSNRAISYMRQDKLNKAKEDLQRAVELNPNDPVIRYNCVAFYSIQGQMDLALDALNKALELGFNDYDSLRNDQDLISLRKHPEYKKILEKHKVFIN
ncbi:MAG: tetratricopeptide repeat protein [Desulfuromonadaceae bacterium]